MIACSRPINWNCRVLLKSSKASGIPKWHDDAAVELIVDGWCSVVGDVISMCWFISTEVHRTHKNRQMRWPRTQSLTKKYKKDASAWLVVAHSGSKWRQGPVRNWTEFLRLGVRRSPWCGSHLPLQTRGDDPVHNMDHFYGRVVLLHHLYFFRPSPDNLCQKTSTFHRFETAI